MHEPGPGVSLLALHHCSPLDLQPLSRASAFYSPCTFVYDPSIFVWNSRTKVKELTLVALILYEICDVLLTNSVIDRGRKRKRNVEKKKEREREDIKL